MSLIFIIRERESKDSEPYFWSNGILVRSKDSEPYFYNKRESE